MRALEKDRVRRYDTAERLGPRHPAVPGRRSGGSRAAVGHLPAAEVRPEIPAVAVRGRGVCSPAGVGDSGQRLAGHCARRGPSSLAQSERNRAIRMPSRLANEQTDRALKAEQIARAELERVANQVRRIKEATVYLKNQVAGKTVASGTGFVVDVTGDSVLLATSRHVAVPDLSGMPKRRRAAGKHTGDRSRFPERPGAPARASPSRATDRRRHVRRSQHRAGVSGRQACEAATSADQHAQSLGPGARAWPT